MQIWCKLRLKQLVDIKFEANKEYMGISPYTAGLSEPLLYYNPFYFVAKYRPHISHFWENVIFAIPT